MPTIRVTTREGDSRSVEACGGSSLMEALREGGIDELLALCGGCLSCATCHVHVDADWIGWLPSISRDEDELLGSALDRDAFSRLSCQIPFNENLDGIHVIIAAAE